MTATRSALAAVLVAVACARHIAADEVKVFVGSRGDDLAAGSRGQPLRTVHEAAARVRALVRDRAGGNITVVLLPGTHHVGAGPLTLGPEDGGNAEHNQWVTWVGSSDAANPSIIGAPVKITGWGPHPTNKKALVAPVPAAQRGTALRQFWVNGKRAERPVIYGHGRQPGDNR